MRQAGRILPSYQKLKSKHSFSEMMNDPDLAAQVTLLPIKDLGVDAAILFSDILTVPDAMGLELYFEEGEGPKFKKPLQDEKSIQMLDIPDVEEKLFEAGKMRCTMRKEIQDQNSKLHVSLDNWIKLWD